MEKKYIVMEWVIMEGGYLVEFNFSLYSFIHDELYEARMFRTKEQISREGARSLTDHLFVGLLSLYAMSNDYNYAPVAKEYAKRTTQLGNWNNPSPSNTDMYMTLYSLQRPDTLLKSERDQLLMNKVRIDGVKIKRFLNQIKTGNITPGQAQQFFFKMERDLKIQDPKLRAARRLTQDWNTLTTQQQQLVATQLNRHYRLNARRSDLMPLFTKYANDSDLLLRDQEKKTIKQRVLRGIGAFAAGYAIGKALPS